VELARPGERINADAWTRSEGWCEHCRTRRARRTTYLLRNVDGRLAQVGSSCLAEFLGGANLPPISRPPRKRADRRRPGVRVHAAADYFDTVSYLAQVAHAILVSGFNPASAASRRRPATWNRAAVACNRQCAPTARAERRAEEALRWIRNELVPRDDFERRLQTIIKRDRLTPRELPTAAAGINAYHQYLRRQVAARKRAEAPTGDASDAT